jgi:hypothetical protein
VLRTFASATLSLLMLTTLLWGGCMSCDQFFMVGSAAKKCCAPDGHCKRRSDHSKSDPSKECKQLAMEHSNFLDHTFAPVPSPQVAPAIAEPMAEHRGGFVWVFDSVEPSPPDLQALHSTFLI